VESPLLVFSGSAHPALARAICAHLGVPLGRARTVRFLNENLKVKIEENVRAADVFVVQPSCPPVSEGIVELLIMLDALRYASAQRITAVCPYFPYVRSDKKDEPRISISARLCADLLQTAGADRVIAVDLHSPQVQGFFRVPSDQLTAREILADHFRRRPDLDRHVVVAPDAGEVKDAAGFAKRLGVPLAIVDKRRFADDEKAHAVHLVGEVRGRRCLIVDDEIATGGTVLESADFVLREGAADVSVAATHPVFSGDAIERLAASPIAEIVVTDTLPLRAAAPIPKVTVLSVAGLLAEAIARVHDGRSVSQLFG
jgi:ribose-phosphate pyrophosphokinase